MELEVNVDRLGTYDGAFKNYKKQIGSIRSETVSIKREMNSKLWHMNKINVQLETVISGLESEKEKMDALMNVLEELRRVYEKAEKEILDAAGGEITENKSDSSKNKSNKKKKDDYDYGDASPKAMVKVFDDYIHGRISEHEFYKRLAAIVSMIDNPCEIQIRATQFIFGTFFKKFHIDKAYDLYKEIEAIATLLDDGKVSKDEVTSLIEDFAVGKVKCTTVTKVVSVMYEEYKQATADGEFSAGDIASVTIGTVTTFVFEGAKDALAEYGLDMLDIPISGKEVAEWLNSGLSGFYEGIDETFSELNQYINKTGEFIDGAVREGGKIVDKIADRTKDAIGNIYDRAICFTNGVCDWLPKFAK